MSLDFTLRKYEELCKTIKKSNYPIIRLKDYFKEPDHKRFIILRHDVDKLPENALAMAQLERSLNISSTYYFRTIPEVFNQNIIKKISDLGHEIGYHYEDLTQTKGDLKKALQLFKKDLKQLRKITNITTICMHGSPLSKWNNSDLWKKHDFKKYGIIGEPYLSIDYNEIGYFTDTGRTWCDKGSIRDFVNNSLVCEKTIKSTNDLIKFILSKKFKKIIVLVHPQRWSVKSDEWLKELIAQNIKNIGKELILKKIKNK